MFWDGVRLNCIAYAGSELSSPVDSWVYQDLSRVQLHCWKSSEQQCQRAVHSRFVTSQKSYIIQVDVDSEKH